MNELASSLDKDLEKIKDVMKQIDDMEHNLMRLIQLIKNSDEYKSAITGQDPNISHLLSKLENSHKMGNVKVK
ncbi:unnamed protein product [Gordionus sp. m RMFG-2023]